MKVAVWALVYFHFIIEFSSQQEKSTLKPPKNINLANSNFSFS